MAGLLKNRWFILFGGFLLNLMLGIVYSYSVFKKPLMNEYGWSDLTASLPFMIFLAVFALMMIPAGRLQDKLGPRKVAIVGGVLMGAGYMLASLIGGSTNVAVLVCTYGLIAGAGCGLGYACAIPVARKWFPDKPALAVGIVVGGFGLSAMVFSYLQTWMINNLGSTRAENIADTFLYIGIVLAVLAVVAALILRNPPAGWKPANWEPKAAATAKASEADKLGAMDVIKSPRFWMLWLMFVFMALAGLMTIGSIASYAKDVGIAAGTAAIITGVLSAFNALGRPGSGWMSDKLSYIKAMMILFTVMAVVVLLFPFVAKGAAMSFIMVIFIGFCFGSCFSLFPTGAGDNFGVKNMGRNYGLLFTAYGVGGIAGPLLLSQIKDSTGEYTWAFIIAAILVFVAVGIAFTMNRIIKKAHKEQG